MNDTIQMPRGWKRIPIPKPLQHLPKDKRGFPIPYVAEWSNKPSDEAFDRGRIPGVMAVKMPCNCVVGVGEPDLGHQCPIRQRECMSERKCQVCSLPILEDMDLVFLGGPKIKHFWEPPLHLTCAVYALQVCPGITRRQGMGVVQARNYELWDRYEFINEEGIPMDVRFVPTGGTPFMAQFIPAAFAYHGAVPINGRRMTAEEFLEESNG